MSRVSIIIPCYNQAEFVAEAVESALNQTFPDVEVIVVDDGSVDNPHLALRPYQSRIRYIRQENRGLSAARNTGLAASSGDYLLFLDSDDCLAADALTRHTAILEAHSEYALTYSAWRQVSENGVEILGEVHPREQGYILEKLLKRNFFFFCSGTVIRRSCLYQVGSFDETLSWGEDGDLWLRLASMNWPFGYLDEPLMNYRIHHKSMTAKIAPHQIKGWSIVLDKFFAQPNLPAHIYALKVDCYSILHFETAGRYARIGKIQLAQGQIHEGLKINPAVDENWLLEWLAGTALDPRTYNPGELIDQLTELAELRHLRQRALGRFHMGAAFKTYAQHDYAKTKQHIIPAILADPRAILNRGFLRIAFEAFAKRVVQNG